MGKESELNRMLRYKYSRDLRDLPPSPPTDRRDLGGGRSREGGSLEGEWRGRVVGRGDRHQRAGGTEGGFVDEAGGVGILSGSSLPQGRTVNRAEAGSIGVGASERREGGVGSMLLKAGQGW